MTQPTTNNTLHQIPTDTRLSILQYCSPCEANYLTRVNRAWSRLLPLHFGQHVQQYFTFNRTTHEQTRLCLPWSLVELRLLNEVEGYGKTLPDDLAAWKHPDRSAAALGRSYVYWQRMLYLNARRTILGSLEQRSSLTAPPACFFADPEVMLAITTQGTHFPGCFSRLSLELRQNLPFMRQMVEQYGYFNHNVPEPLRDDPELALSILQQTPSSYRALSERLRRDRPFIEQLVRVAFIFECLDPSWKDDADIALIALEYAARQQGTVQGAFRPLYSYVSKTFHQCSERLKNDPVFVCNALSRIASVADTAPIAVMLFNALPYTLQAHPEVLHTLNPAPY